jgi:hypothetical protein
MELLGLPLKSQIGCLYFDCFKTPKVFSAVEAQKSKSSIVAVKVASLPSHLISVTTLLSALTVLTCKPAGVLKLSGETALAIASAVLASEYSSVIVACKFFHPSTAAQQAHQRF